LVEQCFRKAEVAGSNPAFGSISKPPLRAVLFYLCLNGYMTQVMRKENHRWVGLGVLFLVLAFPGFLSAALFIGKYFTPIARNFLVFCLFFRSSLFLYGLPLFFIGAQELEKERYSLW
jgi:hypothetical protein